MTVPFTPEVFFALFENYNLTIWPAHIVAYTLGFLALVLVFRPSAAGGRVISAVLALFWLWNGAVYHWLFFAGINFVAPVFAALFVLQGLLFARAVLSKGEVSFRFDATLYGWAGLALTIFAIAGYPLMNWLAGHGWPQMPVFGTSPSPMTIFTLGVLLMAGRSVSLYLVAVPVLWAIFAGTAAPALLNMPEDIALLLAGVASGGLLVLKRQAPDTS